MAQKAKSLLSLPAMADTWYCGIRSADTWVAVEKGSDELFRPFVVLVVQLGSGLIVASEIMQAAPSPEELQQMLFAAMRKPAPTPRLQPHRPGVIGFEEEGLAQAMVPLLDTASVQARYLPLPPEADEALKGLLSVLELNSEPELPGLLDGGKVTPEQAGEFFRAAAEFYRAEPWVQLGNEDVLAIQVLPGRNRWLAIVMGQAGQEYGLSLFGDVEELERFMREPMSAPSSGSRHALLFTELPYLSFGDMDAVERYGWELPKPGLYPTPMVFKQESVGRPDAAMLRWYEAALRAIPLFVEHHLVTNAQGEPAPSEAEITAPTSTGEVRVRLTYPAADISQIVPPPLPLLEGDEGTTALSSGRSAAEKYFPTRVGDNGGDGPLDDALGEAQGLIYEAWEERKPERRVALARRALELSRDCADAYVILAEDAAETANEALALFEAGMAASRRALGEAFFFDPENLGYFWGILETRPFMRALEGLAGVLEHLGRTDEAIAGYRELLRLNPGDNQGIRYHLLRLLVGLSRDEEAQALLNEYQDDWSAEWSYTAALLAFRRGAGPESDEALETALVMNPHVPTYLTGRKRIPTRLPDHYSPGDKSEAVLYAAYTLSSWRKTPGAVEWLRRAAAGDQPPTLKP